MTKSIAQDTTICRESGEPHAVYTDGSVCRCEILPPNCTCSRKPLAAHAADCALVRWETARISGAGTPVSTDEPTGRQIEARGLKAGDRTYEAIIGLDPTVRLITHVEPNPDNGTLLVVYQGGGFEDLELDEVVTVLDEPRTDEQKAADTVADGMLSLAAFVRAHPTLAGLDRLARHGLNSLLIYLDGDQARQQIDAYVTAARVAGAKLFEYDNGDYAGVTIALGPIGLRPYARKSDLGAPPPPPPVRPFLAPLSDVDLGAVSDQ